MVVTVLAVIEHDYDDGSRLRVVVVVVVPVGKNEDGDVDDDDDAVDCSESLVIVVQTLVPNKIAFPCACYDQSRSHSEFVLVPHSHLVQCHVCS